MTEFKIGTRVAFMYDGVTKEGTVREMYEDLGVVVVNVPKDKAFYKVSLSDATLIPEPNDPELKTEDEAILITPAEFKAITQDTINMLSDPDFKTALTLVSELLSYKIFGTTLTK